MKQQYGEGLFSDTTMTFGEHLEELRACLFKSLIGIVIGFVIGLSIGKYVVALIQRPLEAALTDYYSEQAVIKYKVLIEAAIASGQVGDLTTAELEQMVYEVGMLPEEVFVDRRQLEKYTGAAVEQTAEPDADAGDAETAGTGTTVSSDDLVQIRLWRPIAEDDRIQPIALSFHEPFMIFIKASLVAGLLISSPWVFYQVWSFVAAGLYPHEKHYVHVFLPFSLGLFFAGASLAFFFVFEPVLRFLLSFTSWLGINMAPRMNEWMSFVLLLPLGFGVSFQLPLVMLFLERIGIFDADAYAEKWRIAVLVIFMISMFLTPADPGSMLLMAIPLCILYVGGIGLCRYMPREKPLEEMA